MTVHHVHTLGDSILDNFFWMLEAYPNAATARQHSVEGFLQTKLGNDYAVESLAYDGFTTRSVLVGDTVGAVLPKTAAYSTYMQEKAPPNNPFVQPLELLKGKIAAAPAYRHYVVLSVGGNNFRENLSRPWRLFTAIPQIQREYLEILGSLEGCNVQPIIMLQYRTDAHRDPYRIYPILRGIGVIAVAVHVVCLVLLATPLLILAGKVSLLAGGIAFLGGAFGLYESRKVVPLSVTKDAFSGKNVGMALFGTLIHSFYQPILRQAVNQNIPVLDLPNTFNPHEPLYTSGIEPNERGGELIAEGIAHIIRNHGIGQESLLYSKWGQGEYVGAANTPASWRIAYP